MKLQEFIDMYGISTGAAARIIEMSAQHLRQIIRGAVRPSRRLARDISEYTKGVVSVDEILAIKQDSEHEENQKTG